MNPWRSCSSSSRRRRSRSGGRSPLRSTGPGGFLPDEVADIGNILNHGRGDPPTDGASDDRVAELDPQKVRWSVRGSTQVMTYTPGGVNGSRGVFGDVRRGEGAAASRSAERLDMSSLPVRDLTSPAGSGVVMRLGDDRRAR